MSFYFNWNYHTGNRITLPTNIIVYDKDAVSAMLFQAPYNTKLPDYHRLDIGADFNIVFRNDTSLNFNFSIYNVYNHLNASIGMLSQDENGEYYGLAYGLVPIIPTVSIGYKF